MTHTFLVLVSVGLGHGVYRKLYTLIGGWRAEKFENCCHKQMYGFYFHKQCACYHMHREKFYKFYSILQNSRLLGCERVMETWAEFHFSWVYTYSATLSSLRNWANNDRYRLRPSIPAQLCWSSSRLQPLQNYNFIKFALIRSSTLNHDRNLWNFRGAPDETTCFAGFFRCPSALILFLHEIV